MSIYDIPHLRARVRSVRQGLSFTPQYGARSLDTFDSAAPQTYSIICVSSESCLGSIVGFARLPCFGTLRSAISAKVALGALLVPRFCWAKHLSRESQELTIMIRRETGRCSRGLKSLKTFSASGEESALSGLGVYSAPNSALGIRGASPKI